MTSIEQAKRAEHISDALGKFRDPTPEYAQDIAATTAYLHKLSWTLREIDRLTEEPDDFDIVRNDLRLVQESIAFTFADVWTVVGTMGEGKNPRDYNSDDYRRAWKKIGRVVRDSGSVSLLLRLELYKQYLEALCKIVLRHSRGAHELRKLHPQVVELRVAQERRLREIADQQQRSNAVVQQSNLPKKRSYDRERKEGAPISPTDSEPRSPFEAMSPQLSASSPPMSPAATYSTFSQISSIDNESEHWAKQVFRNISTNLSSTPLPQSAERSECHDVQISHRYPSNSYEAVMQLELDGLCVKLFCHPRDSRAKIVAYWRSGHRRVESACLPLQVLEIHRFGPTLKLCRPLPDGKTKLAWLTLKFSTLERLIIFSSTIMAMRAQDSHVPQNMVWEDELSEKKEYAGEICERNGGRSMLGIYRDRESGAIRLQASALGGSLHRTPIWTAFVTYYISSRTWCERIETNVIYLRELRPYIFSNTYKLEIASNGMYVLRFELRSDARKFHEMIQVLGRDV